MFWFDQRLCLLWCREGRSVAFCHILNERSSQKLSLFIISIVNQFKFSVYMNIYSRSPPLFIQKRTHLPPCPIAYLSTVCTCGRRDRVVVGFLCIKWKPNVKWLDRHPCRRKSWSGQSEPGNKCILKPVYKFSIWLLWEEWALQSAKAVSHRRICTALNCWRDCTKWTYSWLPVCNLWSLFDHKHLEDDYQYFLFKKLSIFDKN